MTAGAVRRPNCEVARSGVVPPDATIDARVRRRLRELRVASGMTLQQAPAAGMDVSTLSRLETGKRRIALDHIPALAAALGVSTDELLGPAPRADPRVRGTPRRFEGMTMWPLTNRGPSTGVHAYRIEISARRRRPPAELAVHPGHDWLYVLEGRLRLLLGSDDLVIESGEAVELVTTTPHWFGAVGGPVVLIGVFGAHGERAHLAR
jgi:transcriptional regulator with XRE-family HTH domain